VEIVLADPVGSVLTEYIKSGKIGEAGSWVVEGIGEDFVPPIADLSQVRQAYSISDAESLLAGRDLLKREGILAGSSSGTLVAAAVKYCREQSKAKRVVTFACDSGNKYLSKLYDDFWMARPWLPQERQLRRPARRDQPPVCRGRRGQRQPRGCA
jgi:cystathionine beta-synthase